MIDIIQSESKKIMYKCCERYATEKKIEVENVQLVLGLNGLNDEEGNTYTMCEQYIPKEEYTIIQVLGLRIGVDFIGYSRSAPPFIKKCLLRYSLKNEIEKGSVKVMCVPTKNEKGKGDILLFLYNGNVYVETISFADLFSEEDVEMPQM
jgi:hypothetical protein